MSENYVLQMASSSTYAFFHCHYTFQKFPLFCVTLCVLHALQNATLSLKRQVVMFQFLSIIFFSWISSIFVGFFKSSRFFCVILYKRDRAWFDVHRSVHCNIFLQYNQHDAPASQIIYSCRTLYMFRTVFPSIIRSSKLHKQQQAYVKQLLLPAASGSQQQVIAAV